MSNKDIEKETLKQFAIILNLAEDKLKEILAIYNDGHKQLEQIIFNVYKKYSSVNSEQFYNELTKFNRLTRLDKEVSEITKTIGKAETIALTGLLSDIAKDSYYRNLFILEKTLKTKVNFKLIRPETIETLVNLPVEGLQFSERLYFNQFKLKQSVKSVLVDGISKGKDIKAMTKDLDEKMNISKNNAMRICRTESARVWYQAQEKSWQDSEVVEEVLFIATLDGRTSPICRSYDGKIFKLGEEPKIPVHPDCRSTYGAYFRDFSSSTRINNETKEFIPYQTYEEWHKNKVK